MLRLNALADIDQSIAMRCNRGSTSMQVLLLPACLKLARLRAIAFNQTMSVTLHTFLALITYYSLPIPSVRPAPTSCYLVAPSASGSSLQSI
jgi:hypothetical protein